MWMYYVQSMLEVKSSDKHPFSGKVCCTYCQILTWPCFLLFHFPPPLLLLLGCGSLPADTSALLQRLVWFFTFDSRSVCQIPSQTSSLILHRLAPLIYCVSYSYSIESNIRRSMDTSLNIHMKQNWKQIFFFFMDILQITPLSNCILVY